MLLSNPINKYLYQGTISLIAAVTVLDPPQKRQQTPEDRRGFLINRSKYYLRAEINCSEDYYRQSLY